MLGIGVMSMNSEVRKVVDHLQTEAAKIKTNCPMEILRLFKYQIVPTNMGGLWNTAFTVMVFAEGDMRAMNAYMLFPMCRMIERDGITIEQIKMMFRETVPISAEFVGTCGLESIWTNVKMILGVLDSIDNKADLKELIEAFAAYQTNFHNWIHFYFPWYAGEVFPLRKKEDVAEMAQIMSIK
jgi:hypothetical protein